MRMRKNISLLKSLLILLCFVLVQGVFADKVIMKNGKEIKGRILKEEPDSITIMTPTMSIILQRKEIETIARNPNLSKEEVLGDIAFEDKQYFEALTYYKEALKTGKNRETLLEKIESIRTLQEEEVKRRFGQQLEQVDRHVEKKEFDSAEALLNQILSNLPHQSLAEPVNKKLSVLYHKKALECLNTVNDLKAEECLKQAIETWEDSYESHLLYAELLSRNPRTYNNAIKHYLLGIETGKQALSKEKIAEYHRAVALLYEYNENFPEAIKHHKIILELDPVSFPDTRERIVNNYLRLCQNQPEDDFVNRREYLKQALDVDSYSAQAHFALACLYYHNNLIDECLLECDRVLELNSKLPDIHYYQAICYLHKKQYEKAKEALERELAINPDNYEALCTLGDYHLNGGKYEDAVKYYERAKDIRKEKYHAYLGLTRAYRKLEKRKKAREFLDEVLKTNPNHIEANVLSGSLYKDSQEYKKALELFNKVFNRLTDKANISNPETRKLLIEVLLQRGELNLIMDSPRIAIADFRESLKFEPDHAETYYHLAKANIKLVKYKEAEQNYFKAQELDPENPKYHLGLGIMYHNNLKQLQKAREQYLKYKEKGGEDPNVENWIKECGGQPVSNNIEKPTS